MTIFQRAMLSIRRNPRKSIFVFLLNTFFISLLFFFVLIFNQLRHSLSAIQSVLDTTNTSSQTDFFHSVETTITEKMAPILQYGATFLFGTMLLFMGAYSFIFFLRRKEFTNFQLIGERKSRIYWQMLLENFIIVNGLLFLLLIVSIFLRAPLTNQLNQVEKDVIDQEISLKVEPVIDKKASAEESEGSIYESGISHFNTAIVTEVSAPSTIEPEVFTLFALFINLFTFVSMTPPALWVIYRTRTKKYAQFT